MTQLAIIADDLSSATDCGAQVARSGESVVVPLQGFTLPSQAKNSRVISVDTNSRSLSPTEAYTAVQVAAKALATHGWRHYYKSVDSTLRGNLGAEIEALFDEVQASCAIVAPAFPKYGRTTAEGVQYLHRVRLDETEFGSDPTSPVREANILKLLASQSKRKTGLLSLSTLRSGGEATNAALRGLLASGIELVVVDVQEQSDLQRICSQIRLADQRIVWVGSTGLAEFVPLAVGLGGQVTSATRPGKRDPRPALVVVGSASEITKHQLNMAVEQASLQLVVLDPGLIIQGGSGAAREVERATAAVREGLAKGHTVGISVSASREVISTTQKLGAAIGLSPVQVASRIADTLAAMGQGLAADNALSGIVATGGDTAKALCDALKVEALEIVGEVEAGIPIVRLLGPTSLPFITKAGGFGSQAAILHAIEMVKQYA